MSRTIRPFFFFIFVIFYFFHSDLFQFAIGSQTSIQLADHYGAHILSLTDAAEFIEFLLMDFKIENQWNVQMLERKRFWECAKGKLVVLDKDKTNQNPNEHRIEWPKFSKQLCKNIYLLLSIVDIELIMFSADLNQAVKNQFFLDFFHFNERKVTDVITLNFKLSRLYALGRILTTHFLKLTSKIEERDELKLDGKIVDQSAYLKRLQYFTRQTVSLLVWMRTHEKFKLSEKHGFWWWMKNSEKNVFEKFEEEMAKKEGGIFQWFHDQTERMEFQNVYEKMEQDDQDVAIEKDEDEDKRDFFMKLFNFGDNSEPGMNNLFNQPPWCLSRVHQKVAIFSQIEKKKIGIEEKAHHQGEIKRQKRMNGNNGNGQQQQYRNGDIEEPKRWKLKDKEEKVAEDQKLENPKMKFTEIEVREFLKLMHSEDFEDIIKNTGKFAIKQFIKKSYKNLIKLFISEKILKAANILLGKIEKMMEEMSMLLIQNTGVECPIQFYDESFSVEEENLFGLAVFYKFGIYLINSIIEKKKSLPATTSNDAGQKAFKNGKRKKRQIRQIVGKGIAFIKNLFHRNWGKKEKTIKWHNFKLLHELFKKRLEDLMKIIGKNKKLEMFIIEDKNEGEEEGQQQNINKEKKPKQTTLNSETKTNDQLEEIFHFREQFEIEIDEHHVDEMD